MSFLISCCPVLKDDLTVPRLPPPPNAVLLRATGPKNIHAEKTLHFLSPKDYKKMKAADRANKKQLSQQYGDTEPTTSRGQRSPRKSGIMIRSLSFEQKRLVSEEKRFKVYMWYTSLADLYSFLT